MIDVDRESFLTVVVAAALAAFAAGLVLSRLPLPVVVLEIVLGIAVGPELLGLAESAGDMTTSSSASRQLEPQAVAPMECSIPTDIFLLICPVCGIEKVLCTSCPSGDTGTPCAARPRANRCHLIAGPMGRARRGCIFLGI